jgi:protein arginine kinase
MAGTGMMAMVEAWVRNRAPWVAGGGPDGSIVVWSQCNLMRNLAGFFFPSACSEDEIHAVEDRVVTALDSLGAPGAGVYCPLTGLDRIETLFLAERRLIPFEMAHGAERGGVYLSKDLSCGIAVNGSDHVCMTSLAPGLDLEGPWALLNVLDDGLASSVDYSFDRRLGYLTSSLSHVGTGLKVSVLLHLPGLVASNAMAGLVQVARQRRHAIYGLKPTVVSGPLPDAASYVSESFFSDLSGALYGDINEAQGDLFLLTNLSALGTSEEEILFRIRHTAGDIVERERRARQGLLNKERIQIEDRVARAFGVANNARLLGFTEGVSVLSSIRLGLDVGLASGYGLDGLNELLLTLQSAHIKAGIGRDCDEWTLSTERAGLFRAHFGLAHNKD